MKKFFVVVLLLALGVVTAFPRYVGDVNDDGVLDVNDVTALVAIILGNATDDGSGATDVTGDGLVDVNDVTALVNLILGIGTPQELTSDVDSIFITYADGTATYQIPSAWADSVTVTVDGGDVTVDNACTTEEYVTVLTGTCSDGSFTYNGTYKTTIVLNGVTLTNSDGAAIDIQDGKRIALELAEGTTNTLEDGSGSQKAALYCKGHMEISKGGSLYVTGNTKHAISSKEYLLVKKTVGTIKVLGAVNDGIHAGQYFKMNGGTVNVSAVGGDGIQAEAKEEGDEYDGQMMINGGTITIKVDSTSVAALKCDSLLTIADGDISITTNGDSDKGIKTNGDVDISGGTITLTIAGGSYTVEALSDGTYDASYTTGIKADGDISISGGDLTITNVADGGKGISADGDVNISGGTQTIYANGAGGVLDTSQATSSESDSSTTTGSYKVYIALPTSVGSSNPYGGSGTTLAWSNVTLYSSDGTQVAVLSDQVSISGSTGTTLTFYYYDFAAATSGTYYFTATYTATGNNGGPGGGGATSTSGTYESDYLSLSLSGSDVYYSVTASSGGGYGGPGSSSSSYVFDISNVTSTYSNGTVASSETDTYSASAIKSDGSVTLSGGTLCMSHSGAISKGIKADYTVTLCGATVEDYPAGTYMAFSADDASYSIGIKCNDFVGESGSLTIEATGAASRGVSSDGTLVISGGTYDITLMGNGALSTDDSSEGFGSLGLKSDGNMQLLAGDITINSSANGGKGIKAGNSSATGANGATLIIGSEGASNDLLTLDVNTTGTYLGTVSSSGEMGMNEGFVGSTKAIKVMGAITVNSGNIHLSTTSDGGEGLESKYTITFNGGILESDTYDDAINAADLITVNDGYIWAHASNNDAIDSNNNGFVFNGGVTIASGTSSPEESFDCDQYNFVVNGGVLIGTGGSVSSVTSASQPYATASISLTKDTYLSIKNSSGSVLYSYKIPFSLSGATVFVSCPSFTSGSSATLVYGSSASGGSNSLWDGTYLEGATLSGGSSTSISPSTSSGGGGWQ